MEPPVAAPRATKLGNLSLGARAKAPSPAASSPSSKPSAPSRTKKKKSAPSPPGPTAPSSATASTSSLLPPRNSTMHASAASLPGLAESPIRRATSVVSLAPSRKKRRAPPPPPPAYATLVHKEDKVEQVEERDGGRQEREEGDQVEEERRRRCEEEVENFPVKVIQESDKSELVKEHNADISREEFEITHDAVMITDVETPKEDREEYKEKKKKKKKDKDREQSREGGEEERRRRKKAHKHHREESKEREERRKHKHHHRRRKEREAEVTVGEKEIVENRVGKTEETFDDAERDALQRPALDGLPDLKIHTHGERTDGERNAKEGRVETGVLQLEPDDAVGTDVPCEERVEVNPMIVADSVLSDSTEVEKSSGPNYESHHGVSEPALATPQTDPEEGGNVPPKVNLEDEEDEDEEYGEARRKEESERRRRKSERRRSRKEEKKERPGQTIATELPSFRGARAGVAPSVKEGERESSMAVEDTDDSDDSLVNSDDELVDLFLSQRERIEAKKARQAKQKDSNEGNLSTGPGNQDLEAEVVVKMSGKQREEERKEQIRREQRRGWGKEAEDAVQQQHGSESVRKALTQLNLGGEEPPAYKREWKAVELDIVDEDIGLPSLSSTRSNSIVEISSDEEGRRAAAEHNMFAMKELEKEVERKRTQPVNQALDEAFAKISLTGQHDSYVTVGSTHVVETLERGSPEPQIICETKNFHVRETARDFDFSDTEDNSLSSHQSSLARGGEDSQDAVRHHKPREEPSVTRHGGEAPSPDSGIHDYVADQCASPVSSLGLCREEEVAAGPSTPDSGLELHGSVSEVTSSTGADVCLQDVAEEGEEDLEERQQSAFDRVELPRRHTGKVLFSMASYNERGPNLTPTPAPRDVARTESYRRVSTQLNSSLAAGMERAKEAEKKERQEQERKAQEERERRSLTEKEEQRKGENEKRELDQRRMKMVEERKYREELEQRRQRAEEADRQRLVAQQRKKMEKEEEERRLAEELEARYRKKEGEGVIRASSLSAKPSSSSTFRSRIIEEFECRRGVVIVGGAGARTAAAPPRHSAQSTTTGQEKRAEAGGQQETRSLDRREMPSWGGQFSSLQRAPEVSDAREMREPLSLSSSSRGRGPPSISMQVWGEEPRVGGVVVKEDRDTALGRRVSQPAATEEVVTSGGSTLSTGGQYKHRSQQQPSATQPKAIEIRQRSGQVVESGIMENPRAAVVSAAKNSRGGDADTVWGARTQVSLQTILSPSSTLLYQKPTSYGRGFVGALANGFEQSVEGVGAPSRQPFYFGMSPPDKEEMPSLPTAVGKVHNNETLSQPFRTAPRHRKKETKEPSVREVKIVPVKHPQPSLVNKSEIVIENNNINFSSKGNNNNNNNSNTMSNMNTVRKSASRVVVPPREQAQDELSRAFQSQLAAAKLKLRTSVSGDGEEEGTPPPPPPPVLPPVATPVVTAPPPPAPPSKPTWERRVSTLPRGPIVNPRDELMRAIRERGGKPGRSVPAM